MNNNNTELWFYNPLILFNKNEMIQIWPDKNMTKNQKINAISRLVIILSILGYLLTNSVNFFVTGLITLGLILLLYKFSKKKLNNKDFKKTVKENFTSEPAYEATKNLYTNPSKKNPFMNVLLTEITDDPNRQRAAPSYNRAVEKQINKNTEDWIISDFDDNKGLKKKLFSTLGDNFDFQTFGQYNFYANPSTTIPNKQGDFANWCYGEMISAKEGNDFALIRDNPRIGAVAGQ